MRFGINTIDDMQVYGKTVLLRVDINQPVDRATGTLRDTTRIRACVPTIQELAEKGARVVLLAHQGSDIEYANFYTTRPHAKILSELLGLPVQFVEDVCGPTALGMVQNLKDGEVLLLDNVRFVSEEQTLFELKLRLTHEQQADTLLVRKLAPLADLYICDAFAAAHRDQPSLCGFEQLLPSAMGRLFEEEYCVISELMENPARPCVFILGGAKIADAFLMMGSVLERGAADTILAGGLVAQICLWASGVDIGEATREFIIKKGFEEYVAGAGAVLEKHPGKIVLPGDLSFLENGTRRTCPIDSLPNEYAIADIGEETAARYQAIIGAAQTAFANGPMGVFEDAATEAGTRAVWRALGDTAAHTVIGGGDSIAAANKYGVADKIDYICTGGGALIRFLSGEELPVVKALRHGARLNKAKLC